MILTVPRKSTPKINKGKGVYIGWKWNWLLAAVKTDWGYLRESYYIRILRHEK